VNQKAVEKDPKFARFPQNLSIFGSREHASLLTSRNINSSHVRKENLSSGAAAAVVLRVNISLYIRKLLEPVGFLKFSASDQSWCVESVELTFINKL